MDTMFFMTAASIFITVFFIAIIVIISNLKTWATKRDKYYDERFSLQQKNTETVLNELRKLLGEIRTQTK